MGNTFANAMDEFERIVLTENGAIAHSTTKDKVYDMFALGAAYRKREDEDCVLLFKNAFEEDRDLAMKCLFYMRDCRGGQGERRFFRTIFRWVAEHYPDTARKNIKNLPEYGRWDDLFILFDTPLEKDMLRFVFNQFRLDLGCKTPSLLGKWMPSENASSRETKKNAHKFIKFFGITAKEYRKDLVSLRSKIKIIETLMSQNRWDEIEFDKIPSIAGFRYRNAFARHDVIAKKYEEFVKSEKTEVNADTLYPYEIVAAATKRTRNTFFRKFEPISDIERATLEKYWNNLPNYCEGNESNLICVVDTSGSMTAVTATPVPINVAIALGMYCAERLNGPFKDHFITFSRDPHYVTIEGIDFVDKVRRIFKNSIIENTDLNKTFDLIYNTALRPDVKKEDVPDTIVIISDMEIDSSSATTMYTHTLATEIRTEVKTLMERQREKWAAAGLKMPRLVYWNVQSRNQNKFLDDGEGVTYVSGASPTIFEAILKGKSGIDLMYDVLNSDRYAAVVA